MQPVRIQPAQHVVTVICRYCSSYITDISLSVDRCGAGQVHNLTIRAKGKVLLEGTTLTITAGRRYGLVGPNGMGKSTLLRMIARRQVPVPETLDVLLVEQVRHLLTSFNFLAGIMYSSLATFQNVQDTTQKVYDAPRLL